VRQSDSSSFLAVDDSAAQGRALVAVPRVQICAVAEEEEARLHVAGHRSDVQRRTPEVVLDPHIAPIIQQRLQSVDVPFP
jgi:hypothetical protein